MSVTRVRASICMAAVTAVVAAACSGDARRRPVVEPLVLRVGTFGSNVPGSQTASQLASILSSEPLISVGWNGRPTLRIAAAADLSADGRGLTVRLRPDAKFHSGEPVTAAAVRDLLIPKFPLQGAPEVSGVEIVDDHTLRITLDDPYSLKPADLSGFIIDDDAKPELRTGPFRIVSDSGAVVLERFDEYYLGAAQVDRIEIHEYPSLRAAWTAMMRGELNFLHEVNRETIEFLEGSDVRTYPLLRPYYVPLVFNLKHPVLRRREVRLALSDAIDRYEVVDRGMAGRGRVAEGPFWPHHWAYEPARYPPVFAPDAAKSRLESAGLPERPRANAMPSRLQFTCLVLQGDARFERIALVVQRQLFGIGVDMQLLPVTAAEFVSRLKAGNFDAYLFELVSSRALRLPYRMWHSRAAVLPTGYSAADAALDRLRLARTDDEVRAAIHEVMDVMRSDPPAVFLAMPREVRAADAALDIPYEPDRDVLGSLWQATRAAAPQP